MEYRTTFLLTHAEKKYKRHCDSFEESILTLKLESIMGCIIITVTLISVKPTPLGRHLVIYTNVRLVKMTLGASIGSGKGSVETST